ncbi:MAG: efflux RND transporter periplasmic adaptor subunit, partial [Gemmatimonadaceae bacterium]|nr:efflux RND transporter periplasmic adaptor subunit [Gemmatimonadaceae bacterium]
VDLVAVDYNDRVTQGQVLARVNTDQLRAEIDQTQAALQAAEATVRQTTATLQETTSQAARAESLFAGAMISAQERESAQAALARAQAADANARAQVAAARAALDAKRAQLSKATIRAPISGIVLERAIEPGRTVAATLQTPVLFVLAADLAHMTLALDVDEADIGQVAGGETATFTVDAYPDRTFSATVRSVRYAPKTVEGVVTYQVILDVANPDLLLRPGMTATAQIHTAHVQDALLVPNAALRFTPPSEATPGNASQGVTSAESRGAAQGLTRRVWTLRNGAPVAIPIATGLSDGQWTEVTRGELAPGTPLITGVRTDSATSPSSTRRTATAGAHPPMGVVRRPSAR